MSGEDQPVDLALKASYAKSSSLRIPSLTSGLKALRGNSSTTIVAVPKSFKNSGNMVKGSVRLSSTFLAPRGPSSYKPVTISSSGNPPHISVPLVPTSSSNLRIPTPSSVTIQKTHSSLSSSSVQRTISLPLSPASVIPIVKPVTNTPVIPVARVCPLGSSVDTSSQAINLSKSTHRLSTPYFYDSKVPTTPARIISYMSGNTGSNVIEDMLPNVSSTPTPTTSTTTTMTMTSTSKITSSPRPSILRRRAECESHSQTPASPICIALNLDEESSGSTTLSATSSPGSSVKIPPPILEDPSPRKKPRKQTLASGNIRADGDSGPENAGSDADDKPLKIRKKVPEQEEEEDNDEYDEDNDNHHLSLRLKKETPALLHSYRQSWKSRHNHFLRHSDVRVKEGRRPTVNELANHRFVHQQINGWKIYHLSSQMEDIFDMEAELTLRLSNLQDRLQSAAHSDVNLVKVQEIIKANLQRSKIVADQVAESKEHLMDIFNYKPKIVDIIHKYTGSKRNKMTSSSFVPKKTQK